MIRESLFASSEREAKLNTHGDVLQDLEACIDFSAIACLVDGAAPRLVATEVVVVLSLQS